MLHRRTAGSAEHAQSRHSLAERPHPFWSPLALAVLVAVTLGTPAGPVAAQASEMAADMAVLSIDDLVNTVLQHNPALKTARFTVDVATAGVTTAGAYPNPRIEMGGGRNSTPAAAVSGQAGTVTSVGVAQLVENPALRSARINSSLFAEQSSRQALSQVRNDLVSQVKLRAYEYLLRREEALAAAEALSLLEQTRERIKVRVETGEAGKFDLIRADAEIVNARQREETARLQIAQGAIALNRLAAGMLPPKWELDAQLNDTAPSPSLDALKLEAVKMNPEIRVLEAELERARSRIEEARQRLLPGVDLRLSQVREPDVRQDIVGVSVQVPIFDQLRGPRAEALADRERTLARLDGRRAELVQQLELAWRSVEIARVRVQALSEGAVKASEAALRVAEAAYRFGERGILEVLDAQRVLRAVRQDLLLARFQLQSSLIELDTLAGRYAGER
jgi:cobalt-zinc-cadmium efflux system outer membrane protein